MVANAGIYKAESVLDGKICISEVQGARSYNVSQYPMNGSIGLWRSTAKACSIAIVPLQYK